MSYNKTEITDVSAGKAWVQAIVTHRHLFGEGGSVTEARRAGQIKWVRNRLREHGRFVDHMECTDVRTKDQETQFSFRLPS